MVYIAITLIIVALVLLVISFLTNDKFKDIEQQIEQVSISSMQETYQLKKKIQILEEELLSDNLSQQSAPSSSPPVENKPLIIQKVYHLFQQGYSKEEIAQQTDLNVNDIHVILKNS